jgi:hypothetical protein
MLIEMHKFEYYVYRQLRQVLREERNEAHQFTKDNWSLKDVETVVDAEGINHSGQQHILSYKRGEASAFHNWLIKLVSRVFHCHESDQHI